MCLGHLGDALDQGALEHSSDFVDEIMVSLGFTQPSQPNDSDKMMSR